MKPVYMIFLAFALSIAACSPSASQLEKTLKENPEVLHNAILADPAGFFETVKKAQQEGQSKSMEEQMKKELARVMKEMKEPKEVSVDPARAYYGSDDAKVTIVEWADFNCGHCSTAHEAMKTIKSEYGDKVRIVFKHLPILAEESRLAAEYMEAIAFQDKAKALEFHDKLFTQQRAFRSGGEDFLKDTAKEVGADLKKLAKDRKGSAVKKRIESDIAEAKKFGFNGTPGFMVNGAGVHGAYPVQFFKDVVDKVLGGSEG